MEANQEEIDGGGVLITLKLTSEEAAELRKRFDLSSGPPTIEPMGGKHVPAYCCEDKFGNKKTIHANGDIAALLQCIAEVGPNGGVVPGACR